VPAQLVREIPGKSKVRLRQGTVTSVDTGAKTAHVTLSDTGIDNIPYLNAPEVDDVVSVLQDGSRLLILGTKGGTASAGDIPDEYLTESEANALYALIGHTHAGSGVTDHGALTGLNDDDHDLYLKDKANGGTAAEVPTHSHAGASTAGTVAYADITGTPAAFPSRTTLTITTGSLADAASEDGTVGFPDGARLLKLNVDRACRVRLYTTSAQRSADASRAIGTDVNIATDHGLLFEYVATAAIDTYLSPATDIFQGDGESTVYYRITNSSGSSHTVAAEFDYLRTE
jgi:hypothetical protein